VGCGVAVGPGGVGLGGCVAVGVEVGTGVEVGIGVEVAVSVGWSVGVDVAVGGTSVGVEVQVGVGDGGAWVGVRVGGSTSCIVGVSVGSIATRERPSCKVSTLLQITVHATTLTITRPITTWRTREERDPLSWPVPWLAIPIVSRRTLQ
jgi:hypothetical protein